MSGLKKNLEPLTYKQKSDLVNPTDAEFSVRRQCEILDLNRSSLYYKKADPGPYAIALEDAVRYQHLKTPFYGHIKTTEQLKRMGFSVGWKRVRNLRKNLGIQAIYPKPNLSKPRKKDQRYPYLLKGLDIERVDQVWSTDITYIRIPNKGWLYLTAIIDWYSRYIVSYDFSISLENDFCIDALNSALKVTKPEIMNTDQGSQYTADSFLDILRRHEIKISMDSKGRALDNIRCERFWRSVKYEEVFLKEYVSVPEARKAISQYIRFYNHERIHQSLNYFTPYEVYHGIEIIT